MKSPWQYGASTQDDMEILQTDVMRFMAILGLCLTAIFSLVKSAEVQEPVGTTEVVQKAAMQTQRIAVPNEREMQVSHQSSTEVVVVSSPPAAQSTGFALEFGSAQALQDLVDNGEVRLYVTDGTRFWRRDPIDGYVFAQTPESYYVMEADTVPSNLRHGAPVHAQSGGIVWGVSLPTNTVGKIGALMKSHSSGVLQISESGEVGLVQASQ